MNPVMKKDRKQSGTDIMTPMEKPLVPRAPSMNGLRKRSNPGAIKG